MSPKVQAFRRLHESGCFLMPNPYDRGSAIYLARLGFKALASSSAGFAWSQGQPDNKVTADQVLAHLNDLAGAIDVPLNADFEDGFAAEPERVAHNVTRATATGIAGLSIEDSTRGGGQPLYDLRHAVERIAAARAAIDKSGTGVMLTARAEGFLVGRPDLSDVIKRLEAFAAAGADCLFAPGLSKKEDVATVVKAIAPRPFNLIVVRPWITLAEAAEIGVRRISVGGALARAAWGGFAKAAQELIDHGTFGAFAPSGGPLDLNGIFSR